jgi:hypothetical protein
MKKITILFLCIVLVTLSGCGEKENQTKQEEKQEQINEQSKNNGVPHLQDITTSAISPSVGQYMYNDKFNDHNCDDLIVVSANIVDAPLGTTIKMDWYHVETDKIVFSANTTNDIATNQYISSTLMRPETGWMKGNYIVKFYNDGTYHKSKTFTIE